MSHLKILIELDYSEAVQMSPPHQWIYSSESETREVPPVRGGLADAPA